MIFFRGAEFLYSTASPVFFFSFFFFLFSLFLFFFFLFFDTFRKLHPPISLALPNRELRIAFSCASLKSSSMGCLDAPGRWTPPYSLDAPPPSFDLPDFKSSPGPRTGPSLGFLPVYFFLFYLGSPLSTSNGARPPSFLPDPFPPFQSGFNPQPREKRFSRSSTLHFSFSFVSPFLLFG